MEESPLNNNIHYWIGQLQEAHRQMDEYFGRPKSNFSRSQYSRAASVRDEVVENIIRLAERKYSS